MLLLSDALIACVIQDSPQKPFQLSGWFASEASRNSEARLLRGVLQECVLALSGFLVSWVFFLLKSFRCLTHWRLFEPSFSLGPIYHLSTHSHDRLWGKTWKGELFIKPRECPGGIHHVHKVCEWGQNYVTSAANTGMLQHFKTARKWTQNSTEHLVLILSLAEVYIGNKIV